MNLLSRTDNPPRATWPDLAQRPNFDHGDIRDRVTDILAMVKDGGDEALRELNRKFDQTTTEDLFISEQEMREAEALLPEELKKAIRQAASNIRIFHQNQLQTESVVQTMAGVTCWRKSVAIDRVGLYIPGGSAPLFSTVLMLGIPAQLVGCQEIILCTPPGGDAGIHPAILFSASLCGITKVVRVGGAQAIAAMAYGTETIPKVSKIFGPGNRYVTEAKQQVQQHSTAIDMPAGPSELLVLIDDSSIPQFAAADLLSQAEHGEDSQVLLVSTDAERCEATRQAAIGQLEDLPRKDIAIEALKNSKALYFAEREDAIDFINHYAAEHLILATDDCEEVAGEIVNAGSIFLGHYTPESAGDYASGTNHTLPTGSWARSYSGVSCDSFVKKITYQKLTKKGLLNIASTVEVMAHHEELIAHKRAVEIRRKSLEP